jgi:glycosyltransferase involved in cell wall biosynthesis
LAKPAWERSVLDDLAAKRPWNIRIKAARARALARAARLDDGITVVVVNWNTKDVTSDVIRAVQKLSPPDVRILVVDNGSTDGSREAFDAWPGIEVLLLRRNAGHGVALDLAMCAVRTKVAVTLDSDAIPLAQGWLEPAVTPVRRGDVLLCGLRARRNFVHPVYAAVDTATFLHRRLSFQTHISPGVTPATVVWGENAWDTAELMTGRLAPDEVSFIERTANLVDDLPGMSTGDVVYHHGGVSRATNGTVDPKALAVWREAIRRLAEAAAARQ